ncbi:mediator of RNA polymerase II transcription complex subunit 8-domain-containing protein [Poronia punctata]|nr:mediator of RNA polymerase II transcription complex subunit 8-domain-containing protein [Poronia punctata]
MASLGLTPEELKAVEQTRQRLLHLSSSINSLKNDVYHSNPLPNMDSLQASADILSLNLRAIIDSLTQHDDLFSRIAVHPSTNFPGRTQENVLLQLLRKKPEPDVELQMDNGRKALANLPDNDEAQGTTASLEEVWTANRDACGLRIAEYVMNEEGDFFTAEEREMGVENVRTGLLQKFEDDDDDDDDDDEEEEEEEEGEKTGGESVDLMIIDRPPPPPPSVPAISTSARPVFYGATLESYMRLVTRGTKIV